MSCKPSASKTFLDNADSIIKRNNTNLRADENTICIIKDFLNSPCSYLLLFDSDLIIHKNFFEILSDLIDKTQGVLTLYNSCFHSDEEYNNELCIKKDAGFAGLVIRKDLLQKYIESIEKSSRNYICNPLTDWGLSEFLSKNNIKIFCTKNSQIQHLGITGQNNSILFYDYSADFIVEGSEAQIINDVFIPSKKHFSHIDGILLFLDKIFPIIVFFRHFAILKPQRKFFKNLIAEYKALKKYIPPPPT